MAGLHWIDKPYGKYCQGELEEFLVFCIIDTVMPYEKVCKCFDALYRKNMTSRSGLRRVTVQDIANVLRSAGCRFPNDKARYLKMFGVNPVNLTEVDRDQLVKSVKGIGYKLASMFLRNTRKLPYAVLDVHVDRWLQEKTCMCKLPVSYKERERIFLELAKKMRKDPIKLDLMIWESRRIGGGKNVLRKMC
jgi:N-glycosylase/DNA lyase